MSVRVLLVEDSDDWLDIYRDYLCGEGYELDTARSVREAMDFLSRSVYDVVVTDLKMLGFGEEFEGFSVLQKTKQLSPDTQVVVITGYGSRDIAIRAMQQGAFDYVTKPPEPSRFKMSVRAAAQARQLLLRKRPVDTQSVLEKPSWKEKASLSGHANIVFSGFIANSRGMQVVYERMSKAISNSLPVLIYGEPGSGKEFIARTIHLNSHSRQRKPFSKVACNSIAIYWNNILRNIPRIQGGTLFFDNITELKEEDQDKLLNLIPTLTMHEIRLVTSANVEWEKARSVEDLGVKPSLLQVVSGVTIPVPPLRERKDSDDIPALIGHFISKITATREPKPKVTIASESIRLLLGYDFRKGNIQEMYSIIEHAIDLLGTDGTILPEHIIFPVQLSADEVITILFLAADPVDATRLRLGEEFRKIHEELRSSRLRERYRLELPYLSARASDISKALLDIQPQIVHFSGHGTSKGGLCFENQTGETQLIQPEALAELFKQFANRVKCVVLNACYSVVQAKAIAQHIDYVIGMDRAVGDEAAIAFSVGFYQALGAGRTVEEAFELGRVQIMLHDIPEHLTPVLIRKSDCK